MTDQWGQFMVPVAFSEEPEMGCNSQWLQICQEQEVLKLKVPATGGAEFHDLYQKSLWYLIKFTHGLGAHIMPCCVCGVSTLFLCAWSVHILLVCLECACSLSVCDGRTPSHCVCVECACSPCVCVECAQSPCACVECSCSPCFYALWTLSLCLYGVCKFFTCLRSVHSLHVCSSKTCS